MHGMLHSSRGPPSTRVSSMPSSSKSQPLQPKQQQHKQQQQQQRRRTFSASSSARHSLSEHELQATRRRIIALEVASIVLAVVIFTVWLLLSTSNEELSSLELALCIDSIIDILSFVITIWRYVPRADILSAERDRVASLLLSLIFCLSAICIEFESINNLASSTRPKASFAYIMLNLLQCVCFASLGLLKFVVARRLKKRSTLVSDGINSLITSISGFSLALGMLIYTYRPRMWYFDDIFGFVIGIFIAVYAIQLFLSNSCFYK